MKQLTLLAGSLSLAALLACSGGGGGGTSQPTPPPVATSLAYTDPANVPATSFQFKKAASSSGGRLVLDLYGPATALQGSGLVLTLNVDTTKASWGTFGAEPVAAGTVLSLGSGTPILKGKVTGGTLQVVIAEKGTATTKPMTGPLLQVALELKSGLSPNTAIVPTVDTAKCKVIVNGVVSPLQGLAFGTMAAQ